MKHLFQPHRLTALLLMCAMGFHIGAQELVAPLGSYAASGSSPTGGKSPLAILGEREVCLSNSTTLTTNADPADNLVTWKVYDSDNQPVYTSPTPAAQLSSSVITAAGRYRVTAENANYCNEASFILTV